MNLSYLRIFLLNSLYLYSTQRFIISITNLTSAFDLSSSSQSSSQSVWRHRYSSWYDRKRMITVWGYGMPLFTVARFNNSMILLQSLERDVQRKLSILTVAIIFDYIARKWIRLSLVHSLVDNEFIFRDYKKRVVNAFNPLETNVAYLHFILKLNSESVTLKLVTLKSWRWKYV